MNNKNLQAIVQCNLQFNLNISINDKNLNKHLCIICTIHFTNLLEK
jgi:hypothetical protein